MKGDDNLSGELLGDYGGEPAYQDKELSEAQMDHLRTQVRKDACLNCKFFESAVPFFYSVSNGDLVIDSEGRCCRYPPVVYQKYPTYSHVPVVNYKHWCGEFQPKEKDD